MAELSLKRKLVYSLIPAALLLGGASALLGILSDRGLWRSERVGDSVMYLADDYLALERTREGEFYQIRDAQHPEVVQARFAKDPPADTFRIVITGGSFIRGEHHLSPGLPPGGYGTIADWLGPLLEARHPGRRIEVINAGASAQNSFRVRAAVDHLMAVAPDLLIVGTGNNEGAIPPTRYSEALHEWSVYRAMKHTLIAEVPPSEDAYLQIQTENSEKVRAGFERNLRRIAASARRAETHLALMTLPGNYTTLTPRMGPVDPPEPLLDAAQRTCAEPGEDPRARRAEAATPDELEEALASLLEAKNQARALQIMGDCAMRLGRVEDATAMYRAAAELEPSGRAKPSYNDHVRELAAGSEDVILVDLEREMIARSPGGVPGGRYFIDSCHLTTEGYYEMAAAIAEAIGRSGLLGEPEGATPDVETLVRENGWEEAHRRWSGFGL